MTSTLRLLTALLTLAVSLTPAATAQQVRSQIEEGAVAVPKGDLFIRNLDAVWTANDTVYQGVSILIRDGVVRRIGPNLDPPGNVPVIEGAGFTAIPGLIDEHSHIATRAVNECTAPFVPEIRVIDALDQESFSIYRALSGGVTVAQVLHGSCNPIGAQSAIIKTRWGMEDVRQLLVQGAPQTVKFALGEKVKQSNRGPDFTTRYPQTRMGVETLIRDSLLAARDYEAAWNKYRSLSSRDRERAVPPCPR